VAGKDFGDEIGPNTPLRLKRAAELAFPMGGMTAAGLRREAQRGRLVIERIAGKDFVTLAAIEEMRKLCRVQAKAPTAGAGPRRFPPIALKRRVRLLNGPRRRSPQSSVNPNNRGTGKMMNCLTILLNTGKTSRSFPRNDGDVGP